MSKENTNLRLLGSPVNLSYRSKRKDDKKNIRNRPRSALQNSCYTPDCQDRFKRPFSADTKERIPPTQSFLKSYSEDLLQTYNNGRRISPKKVASPTAELLGDIIPFNGNTIERTKELCSNASDHGSEDTFISLGTKIKTKAQLAPKNKTTNTKALKYRNIAKRGRKIMEHATNDNRLNQNYGLEITITERSPCIKNELLHHRSASPSFKPSSYESYFVSFDDDYECPQDNETNETYKELDSDNMQLDVEKAIDIYSHRLNLTKQQLSLVEEESTQDLESIPSQNLSNAPQDSLYNKNLIANNNEEKDDDYLKNLQNFSYESRTYGSFYDDFNLAKDYSLKTKFSSTVIHTDSSSKDSGYPDSAIKEDGMYQNFSLPSSSLLKKSNSDNKLNDQPKSLDSTSSTSNEKDYHKTYPLHKKWTEPLNHSRLLYKDFFLKTEGHLALPPQNSPDSMHTTSNQNENKTTIVKLDDKDENCEYPNYLRNSSAKAYTSKVIEDYKREIEAINNLHDLTIKDIKTDPISTTPLNVDVMLENPKETFEEKDESIEISHKSSDISDLPQDNKNSLHNNKTDITKVTTKELIQNYFKVKNDYPKSTKDTVIKNLKKFEKKINNFNNKSGFKFDWKNDRNNVAKTVQDSLKHQSPKTIYTTKLPLSARIESVQNDKDVDSWMSLAVTSPKVANVACTENVEITKVADVACAETSEISETLKPTTTDTSSVSEGKAIPVANVRTEQSTKARDLDSKSTVLDIYSMLKEIESYGDNPVTVPNVEELKMEEVKEGRSTPKDNFMEIFEFLEKVEQSANDALSVITNSTPQTTPKLEVLLKLPQTELAQRLVTASLQLEERSCCIALLQESLANHKQQMISKVSNLEKQSQRNIMKVKQDCEETIKRHQNFIDQLINDKKTLNHRIEQLVDERRALEERWKRSVQTLEERYKLELRNQHDKMAAAQQVAKQRWVRQKAEKIKELTVKGLESELREMADRQQKEISDLKMAHAEQMGKAQAKHANELEELRRTLEQEKEDSLVKERQLASSRLEKQILEIERTYQEQRTRLVSELRAESERAAQQLSEREQQQRATMEKWKEEQEKLLEERRAQLDKDIAAEKAKLEEQLKEKCAELEEEFEKHKKEFEAQQQIILKKKVAEISAQYKLERDREIEKAIESMEAEAQAGRRELQDALRRNKEQYEMELRELAETEQATLKRYQDAQARVRHTEDRCAELEVAIGQLETRNKVLTEKNIQLENRAEEIRASCDEAWKNKMDALNKELEDTRIKHDEQMHQLYAKVKIAVARKDSTIQALTRENAKHQEKVTLLEQKLQQQRKDFLKQK